MSGDEHEELTCKELCEFLGSYIDGELEGQALVVFESHLSLCYPCVDYVDSLRTTIRVGKAACTSETDLPKMPQALVQAILAARRAQQQD